MRILGIASLILVLSSCQVAKDINRVGGGYVDKENLKGEWYLGTSIVDKQYHNASSFIGNACLNDRVRFEVTEKMLYAYRSYEKIPGTEGSNPGNQHMLAAFKITKHFEPKREYNELTGIENNVIVENDYDKKWYQRRYMWVDWSKNLAPDTSCNDWFTAQSFAQIRRDTNPREPYRTRISKDYIELTEEALVKPSEGACRAVGEWNCAASRVKMKMSFSRVKSSSYEPKAYPDFLPLEYGQKGKELCIKGEEGCSNTQELWTYSGPAGTEICDPARHNIDECKQHQVPVFSRFGYFRTEKFNFDRQHGFTLAGREQLINRWNLWEDAEKTKPKPIIYYLNVQFPEDLIPAAQEVAKDWSSAFKSVTGAEDMFQIRRNTCNIQNVSKFIDENGIQGDMQRYGVNQIDVGNLEEICAVLEWISLDRKLSKVFAWEQLGDVRYSIINYTNKAELAGPLGYGPSFADPLTGEIIQASVNLYGPSLDTYASMGADIVQGVNGQMSFAELSKDDPKAVPIQVAKDFKGLVRSRTAHLKNTDFLVQIPDGTPSNWELLKPLGLEKQYLLKEFMPSEWEANQNAFEKKLDFWAKHNACYSSEILEPQVADLAEELKDKSWMEAYQYIRAAIFKGVVAHEIGHTLGLRHNFSGSYDAMNFFPNFWKAGVKRKSELQYSSIMDYMQRFNSDFAGIGFYDRAAIKFGYGDKVEVFDQSGGEFVPTSWATNSKLFHYTDLPYLYAGQGLNEKLKAHYQEIKDAYDAGENAVVDLKSLGVEPKPENLHKRKDVSFSEFYIATGRKLFGKKGQGVHYEVPYQYCSDAYASGVSLNCNRWDMGASSEEIVNNAAELYENYYWLNSFRRDRISISPENYMARLYDRTYRPMLNPFRYLYYYHKTSLSIWPLVQDWSAAAYKGLNFFGKVLQSVEPGKYCLTKEKLYIPESEVSECLEPIQIGLDQGRYYDTHYSQGFFFKPNNIGHMYDKLLAMQALTDSRARFMRDFSDQFNRGAFSIGYYRVFAPEMIKVFTNLVLDKDFENSPEVLVENGKATIKYRPLVELTKKNEVYPRIKSSGSWAMRYYGLLMPMVNFTSPMDGQLDFSKRARITLAGSKQDPSGADLNKQVLFEDPSSHLKYRASILDSAELSPGYLILNDTKNLSSKDVIRERMMLIELLRMVGDAVEGLK